jgi:hypothetical protein
VLAIQDTTMVRSAPQGLGVALHPVLAVDAVEGTLLGLVDARFMVRRGGQRGRRFKVELAHKESRRWLDGARSAAGLKAAGAACVTVVADREGDIYEDFACKPDGMEMLVRAGQDRKLVDGSRLFARSESLAEAGRMHVELPAAPGRPARRAVIAVALLCRRHRPAGQPPALPRRSAGARLSHPGGGARGRPAGRVAAAHWRLLTTHEVNDIADARRIVGFYRQRWTIEQLFRTLKTQGFDVEALRQAEDGPFEKLVAASLIAAVTVLQLVRERDGAGKCPLESAFDPDDRPVLETVSASLEGKTARQKNPHPPGSLAFAAWVSPVSAAGPATTASPDRSSCSVASSSSTGSSMDGTCEMCESRRAAVGWLVLLRRHSCEGLAPVHHRRGARGDRPPWRSMDCCGSWATSCPATPAHGLRSSAWGS